MLLNKGKTRSVTTMIKILKIKQPTARHLKKVAADFFERGQLFFKERNCGGGNHIAECGDSDRLHYFAYSIALLSRITCTLI